MRLIDADAANVDDISYYYGSSCYAEDVEEWLNEQPTIEAEIVVRCKDCKYFHNLTCKIRKGSWGEQLKVGFTDFCSDGERRSDK